MVSGCGLGQDTTTSLAALGFETTTEMVMQSLRENIAVLSRTLTE
jgi:hypothetical protein